MGDVVIRRRGDAWQRLIAVLAVLAVVAGVSCTSSKPSRARVVAANPAAASEAPAVAKTAAAAATEIRTLDLREGAPGAAVDLEASAPLVWTSFRNADGKVVVELPHALPRAGLADLSPEDGLVAALKVESSNDGSRPMTRLVITTRQEVEHSVTADGNRLRVQLLPVEAPAPAPAARGAKLAFEPVAPAAPAPTPAPSPAPAPEPVAPAPAPENTAAAAAERPAAPAPLSQAALGTPDRPLVAPAPTGTSATRLDGVEVLTSQGGAVVRLSGDGEFPYATFALDEPERFVIDLGGVINHSAKPAVAVDGGVVERIRVAQFKPYPKPVSRVVFDLKAKVVPVIERTADALVVTFPSGSGASPAAPARIERTETPPASAPSNIEPSASVPKPAKVKTAKGRPAKSARQSAPVASEPARGETVTTVSAAASPAPPPVAAPAGGDAPVPPPSAAASDLALAPKPAPTPAATLAQNTQSA